MKYRIRQIICLTLAMVCVAILVFLILSDPTTEPVKLKAVLLPIAIGLIAAASIP